jgi:hypothetical protein
MKKVVLFALLFAAATASAFAHTEPQMNKIYSCSYNNYSGPAKAPGLSWWEKRPGSTTSILYTFESFQLPPNGTTWENYKATWAKPSTDPYGFTTWEFTFKDGPQCKQTVVTPGGYSISFSQCTDGHTRYCFTQ